MPLQNNPQSPIELYFWHTTNGIKISIMLEELGVPYNIHGIDINKGDQFKPEFTTISPNNKIPAIVDPQGDNGKPLAIFESGAILLYLARKFNRLYPDDIGQQSQVDQWLFWQVGGLGPNFGQKKHFINVAPEKITYAIDRFTNELDRLLKVMDTALSKHEFLAGSEYSIADISCIGWLNLAREQNILADYDNIRRWLDLVLARPAVDRGLKVRGD